MELHNLRSSPSIIRMGKSRTMRWAGHLAWKGEEEEEDEEGEEEEEEEEEEDEEEGEEEEEEEEDKGIKDTDGKGRKKEPTRKTKI
jgi:hypothetical protein